MDGWWIERNLEDFLVVDILVAFILLVMMCRSSFGGLMVLEELEEQGFVMADFIDSLSVSMLEKNNVSVDKGESV